MCFAQPAAAANRTPAASRPGTVTADPQARVGDEQRDGTAELLAEAAAAGYLRLDELDQRLEAAWAARSTAELAAVVSDLPVHLVEARSRRESAIRARGAARTALRRALISYLGVMLLLVGIWLVVGLTAQAWYPWPVWPALGWGIGLLGPLRAGYARTA